MSLWFDSRAGLQDSHSTMTPPISVSVVLNHVVSSASFKDTGSFCTKALIYSICWYITHMKTKFIGFIKRTQAMLFCTGISKCCNISHMLMLIFICDMMNMIRIDYLQAIMNFALFGVLILLYILMVCIVTSQCECSTGQGVIYQIYVWYSHCTFCGTLNLKCGIFWLQTGLAECCFVLWTVFWIFVTRLRKHCLCWIDVFSELKIAFSSLFYHSEACQVQ